MNECYYYTGYARRHLAFGSKLYFLSLKRLVHRLHTGTSFHLFMFFFNGLFLFSVFFSFCLVYIDPSFYHVSQGNSQQQAATVVVLRSTYQEF